MTEVGFYHLTRTSVEQALPQLLGRTLGAKQRAVVVCRDSVRRAALDAALWACPDPNWLPHGTAEDGDADLQPIWLTGEPEAPNGARYLFLVDATEPVALAGFERVFDLFDGKDPEAVSAARVRWKAAKDGNCMLTYWRQGARGWEKGS